MKILLTSLAVTCATIIYAQDIPSLKNDPNIAKQGSERWHKRVASINTMVGTDYAKTKSAGIYGKGSEEHGQTLPAVLAPHGMNFWTPQTRDTEQKCIAPYYYADSLLQGFRASHWIVGGCTQDYGSFTLMPQTGLLRLMPEERASHFSHNNEVSHPYYYMVSLPDEHLTAELTASVYTDGTGSRAAIFRFTANQDDTMHIVVNPNNDYGEGFVAIDTARNAIYGYNPVHRIYQGWGEKAGFSGYFVVQLQKPIEDYGINNDIAHASLKVKGGEQILVRTATSFTSIEGAWKNLQAEMPSWDFDNTLQTLEGAWQQLLSKIDVDDCDEDKISEFYGAMYRASFLPHVVSDVDGMHPKFAGGGNVKQASPYYDDFSMWDIYRAQLPLLSIIDPMRMTYMTQSLVNKYDEGGWMPIFPCWNSYTAAMIGDHAASAIADAWVKGIRGFDINKAYEGIRKNAFQIPTSYKEYKDGMGRRALKSYLQYGYIPIEDQVSEAFHDNEQVSRTLEYAYDDFCAAQLAKATGHDADYKELMRRSGNWRNVFNTQTGWIDARHKPSRNKKAGKFLNNKDIANRKKFITEGSVMHYSFYVPHDIDGLISAMGGKEKFITKLDTLFGFTSDTWPPTSDEKRKSYYWHGNEPCHHIAYMYALAGQPRKTEWLIRNILQTEYMNTPGGLSGNDDAGQMSAWYIFSALGFYPVCPGKPEYVIGVPQFRRAKIGALTIETEGEGQYVEQIKWNGKPYTSPTISHNMITEGGVLTFKMKPMP